MAHNYRLSLKEWVKAWPGRHGADELSINKSRISFFFSSKLQRCVGYFFSEWMFSYFRMCGILISSHHYASFFSLLNNNIIIFHLTRLGIALPSQKTSLHFIWISYLKQVAPSFYITFEFDKNVTHIIIADFTNCSLILAYAMPYSKS